MMLDVTYDGEKFKVRLTGFDSFEFGIDAIENEQKLKEPAIVAEDFAVLLKEIMCAIRRELEYKFIV